MQLDSLTYITEAVYIFANYDYLFKLIGSLIIFAVFWGFRKLFTKYLFHLFIALLHQNKTDTKDSFLNVLYSPLKNLIILIGAYLALHYCLPARFDIFLNNMLRSGIIVLFATGVYALVSFYAANERETYRIFNREVDKILIPFLSKIVRFVVLALSFVAIASTWGYDVNGFIAGLGLGGLAFALAAKDLLANIFSGVVIITDKPFSIGDWIETKEVEGIVEDINFRSTRIRSFDLGLVTMPNSSLVNAAITNFSRRPIRRISFQLKVAYNTPSVKLKKCIGDIEHMLRHHPDIDQQTLFVTFDLIGDNSLEIFVYCFTRTAVWAQYLTIKQDVNFKILEILENEGISFSLPSASVRLEEPASPPIQQPQ